MIVLNDTGAMRHAPHEVMQGQPKSKHERTSTSHWKLQEKNRNYWLVTTNITYWD